MNDRRSFRGKSIDRGCTQRQTSWYVPRDEDAEHANLSFPEGLLETLSSMKKLAPNALNAPFIKPNTLETTKKRAKDTEPGRLSRARKIQSEVSTAKIAPDASIVIEL